jgi:hypothetical protein
MEAKELIDIIYPNHDRTSCSDDNIYNGFYFDDYGTISTEYYHRCKRCALLQIENGIVELTIDNKTLIPERLS